MAQVQPEPLQVQVAATKVPIAIWVLIGLLALVMAITTGLAVATLVDDPATPAAQRVKVPVPVAVDIAAARAMKDESLAAIAVGRRTAGIASGTAAKDEAGVAALVGNP